MRITDFKRNKIYYDTENPEIIIKVDDSGDFRNRDGSISQHIIFHNLADIFNDCWQEWHEDTKTRLILQVCREAVKSCTSFEVEELAEKIFEILEEDGNGEQI